jgi:hypothetical protein
MIRNLKSLRICPEMASTYRRIDLLPSPVVEKDAQG